MKKVFSVIALSALAGTLMLTSCKKDEDNGPSYAEGWNSQNVEASKEQCASANMGTEEECDCFYDKVSQNIGASEFATEEGQEEAAAYSEECFGEE